MGMQIAHRRDGISSVEFSIPRNGVNSFAQRGLQKEGEAYTISNLELSINDTLTTVYGVSNITAAITNYVSPDFLTIWSMHNVHQFGTGYFVAYVNAGGTPSAGNARLYFYNGAWVDKTPAAIQLPGDGNRVRFLEMGGLVVALIGGAAGAAAVPKKYDGGGGVFVPLLGTPPNGAQGAVYQNRMFITRIVATPNRVFYSGAGNCESWTATDYIDVPSTTDSDPIMALDVSEAGLIIYKRRSVYLLSGTTPQTFKLTELNSPSGLVSTFGACAAGPSNYFVGDRGLYRVTGTSVDFVSPQVESAYRTALTTSGADKTVVLCHYAKKGCVLALLDNNAQAGGSETARPHYAFLHDYGRPNPQGHPTVWSRSYYVLNDIVDPLAAQSGPHFAVQYVASDGSEQIAISAYARLKLLDDLSATTLAGFASGNASADATITGTVGWHTMPFDDSLTVKRPRNFRLQGKKTPGGSSQTTVNMGVQNDLGAPTSFNSYTVTSDGVGNISQRVPVAITNAGRFISFQVALTGGGAAGEFQYAEVEYVDLGRRQ